MEFNFVCTKSVQGNVKIYKSQERDSHIDGDKISTLNFKNSD